MTFTAVVILINRCYDRAREKPVATPITASRRPACAGDHPFESPFPGNLGDEADPLVLAVQRLSPLGSRGPKAAVRRLRDPTRRRHWAEPEADAAADWSRHSIREWSASGTASRLGYASLPLGFTTSSHYPLSSPAFARTTLRTRLMSRGKRRRAGPQTRRFAALDAYRQKVSQQAWEFVRKKQTLPAELPPAKDSESLIVCGRRDLESPCVQRLPRPPPPRKPPPPLRSKPPWDSGSLPLLWKPLP